jgi:hypothetical protein
MPSSDYLASMKRCKHGGDGGTSVNMWEGPPSRVMAAYGPYGDWYDFYSVSPEYFGYHHLLYSSHCERIGRFLLLSKFWVILLSVTSISHNTRALILNKKARLIIKWVYGSVFTVLLASRVLPSVRTCSQYFTFSFLPSTHNIVPLCQDIFSDHYSKTNEMQFLY